MLKFTIIIAILAFTNSATALTEEDLKDELSVTIVQAKNRAYEQVESIKILGSSKISKFNALIEEEVKKSQNDMETLKKKFGNKDNGSCDKMQNNINDNARKTTDHFQNCVDKAVTYADYDFQSLASDAYTLAKEIEYAKTVNEELRQKVVDYDARSYQFGKYVKRLETCETQSNLIRLKRQISETLTGYERCLQNK